MRAMGCAAFLSLLLMSSAQAASFDCAKASNFVEKAICSDQELSGMDDQLARLYKAARAAATNASTLEAEQKSWLSSRDRCTDAACLTKAYADRIAALSGPSAGSRIRKLHRHLQDAERRSADSADWRADKVLDQCGVPAEYRGNIWRGSADRQ